MRRSTASWAAVSLLAALVAAPALPASAQSMSSAGQRLDAFAADSAGGDASASATRALAGTLGQAVAASTVATASYTAGAGYVHRRARPGTVLDLAPRADATTSSATVTFTTPGYDGALGGLLAGARYRVRVASYTVPDTFTLAQAQVSVSTQGTAPGDGVGLGLTGLVPNTT
ncbi:MAG: hypothetical protein HY079_00225, partial [Elusimicrobia bacterium]|nr:hypothetical protein [Elusimicrobiota bacterium]